MLCVIPENPKNRAFALVRLLANSYF